MPAVPTRKERRAQALDHFEKATELPLLVLALAMVPLLVVPLLVKLPPVWADVFIVADWFIWAVFALEFGVRLFLTDRRLRFLRRNWADLLIVILPFLRPLRIVRSARALRLLRLMRLGAVLNVVGKEGKRLLVRHQLHYALLVIFIIVFAAAALVLTIEADQNEGSIHSFGDSLWWAVSTVTTVGYGDAVPATAAGRGLAVLLMVAGITLMGLVTANIAAFVLERSGTAGDPTTLDEVAQKLDELLRRMDDLEQLVATGRPDQTPD